MMEPQNNPDQYIRNNATASLGTMLREARERLGLSVEDVVAQTKFAPRQIEALEADDFKHLPEPAFLRGFVRSYAKILNLDAQPLLAALPQEKTAMPELIPPSVDMPYPIGNNSQKQNLILLGAALLLAVLAVGFSVWHFTTPRQTPAKMQETPVPLPEPKEAASEPQVQKQNAAEPAEQKRQTPAATETRQQAANAAETKRQPSAAQSSVRAARTRAKAVTAAHSGVPAAQSSVRAARSRAKAAAAAQSGVPAVQSSARATKIKAEPEPTAGSLSTDQGPATTLRLVFDEESWTEITDKDGKMISSQINPRGSELNVHGHLPLLLVIGHAASTHLYKDGKAVDIAPFINSASDVARVTVK